MAKRDPLYVDLHGFRQEEVSDLCDAIHRMLNEQYNRGTPARIKETKRLNLRLSKARRLHVWLQWQEKGCTHKADAACWSRWLRNGASRTRSCAKSSRIIWKSIWPSIDRPTNIFELWKKIVTLSTWESPPCLATPPTPKIMQRPTTSSNSSHKLPKSCSEK